MKIKFLQAFNGDSILISFKDKKGRNRNILIDGGTGETYENTNSRGRRVVPGDLQVAVEQIRNAREKIDLLVMTHVDDDHIGGILRWFERDEKAAKLIDKVWFNSGRLIFEHFGKPEIVENLRKLNISDGRRTSMGQGATFEKLIEDNKIWERKLIKAPDTLEFLGLKFIILSPDKAKLEKLLNKWRKERPIRETGRKENDYKIPLSELIQNDKFVQDTRAPNGSSIAFVLSDGTKNILFLGDAHPSVIINSLKDLGYSKEKPLQVDLVKVSHHGSKGNTSYKLLELVDCDRFVISSNGAVHNLPDKQCLARIIKAKSNAKIYFNYPQKIEEIFSESDLKEFEFQPLPLDEEFLP